MESRGLHPLVDIFDDIAPFYPDTDEPGVAHGQVSEEDADGDAAPNGAHNDTNDINTGPCTPPGEPPTLTAQQHARLHQLLGQRDDRGRAPYGLDPYPTGEAKWKAYRQAIKTQYRELRREQRQRGEWEPDMKT